MDRNTLIGLILILVVLFGFSILNKPSEEEIKQQKDRERRDSIEYVQTQKDALNTEGTKSLESNSEDKKDLVDNFFTEPVKKDSVENTTPIDTDSLTSSTIEEKTFTLENNKVKLNFSNKGAQLISAEIKGYKRYNEEPLLLFKEGDASLDMLLTNANNKVLRTRNLVFESVPTQDTSSLIMRFAYAEKQYIDFIYKLAEDDYMLKFDINVVGMQSTLDRDKADIFELLFTQKMRRQETSLKNEQNYSSVYYKYIADEVSSLDAGKGESLEVKEPTKWIAFKNQFFASVFIADNKIENVLLDSKVLTSEDYLKSCEAHIFTPAKLAMDTDILHAGFSFYFGPMSYTNLKQYDSEITDPSQELSLDEMVPLGWALFRWINKYLIIPLFNLLKTSGLSVGIVILLLTIIVKLVISPLTYKSFMSSAKMRVLRPQVEEINAKYPKPEQATEKQQAVMALYNRAGANPMSGCIPMLLQMPVLFALFQFFPNAIELRHQSFLWAKDLSTYDAIATLPESLPLIGGTHLSLFCILMTITNVVYTKFNMDATNTGQQQMPGMKWMMYLMPLVFFFVLNDYPSGLTYYYFISLLITILLTIGFRWIVDEEKVLARLEANKAKPKKKSGFMARLEEAQRIQQQQLKEKEKKNKKKK